MYTIYSHFTDEIKNKYLQFLKSISNYSLLQTIDWSYLKSDWIPYLITVEEDNTIKASTFVLKKELPIFHYSFLYSPRGLIFSDKKYLEELTQGINKLAKQEKAFIFKSDPPLDKSYKTLFTKYFQVNSEYLNFDGIQPKFISELNLSVFSTEEEIINSFSSKTRYNINLAIRKGVTVSETTKIEDLESFYNLMKETGIRDNFKIRSFEYFKKMLFDLNKENENSKLYITKYNNEILSGAIIIKHGDTIEYLYGASSNKHRNVMPNYLLQWEMIKYAFQNNYKHYSFGGISGDISNPDNPLYGLYKFKSGFNTETKEFIGEIQIIYKPIVNKLFNIIKKYK